VDIGTTGKKYSLLHVDSNFLNCVCILEDEEKYLPMLDEMSQELHNSNCEKGSPTHLKGSKMMDWINETLTDQSADPNIIWKTTFMHHPMYGEHYHDNGGIINKFLPLIEQHNYDVYFNGHEHMMNYA